jgi:hypothetical protein
MLLADGDHVEHELGLMLVTGSGGVEGVGLQGHGAVHGADVEGDEAEHAQPQQHHIARLPVLMVRLVLWQQRSVSSRVEGGCEEETRPGLGGQTCRARCAKPREGNT